MSPPLDLLPALLPGVVVTLQLTVFSSILALIIAFVVGFGRLSKYGPVRVVSSAYVEFFRGTSLLVQLFWAYFVLPHFGLELAAMHAGVLVLGLNYGAYGSEVVRSSILAVPKSQTEAGIALNMTPTQIMHRIILPQAFLTMLPPFGNLLIELLKGTALVSLITLGDLMFMGAQLRVTTLRTTEVFSLVLIIYFIIAYPLILGVRTLESKFSKGRA
ncbi:ectoine/hydroxyectoine ABC transporter permease subunit EhuC [Desulfallas thermosapovorans]|uniref:ectoine/hydroxyectoine ABC transporter permease subunit EhuC n=1 Tax=Desulfallas thermosapovorans TaxID=58137 RepID=UPI0014123002|nr:ectoine/hydroxyectoine ABC transporter permease subunit EhuC [Desulfallas thermosapovorans]